MYLKVALNRTFPAHVLNVRKTLKEAPLQG